MERLREVDPGDLHLPHSRQDGPNASRYHAQVERFGGSTEGMPRIEVTHGKGGELMINNGVTRAVRVFNLSPGKLVPIEVIDVRPRADFTVLKRVRDVTPPE
jgi:hypothetical protein